MASPPDPVTKQSRGFTFVRFVNPADAERALKEMQKDVNKARMKMNLSSCLCSGSNLVLLNLFCS